MKWGHRGYYPLTSKSFSILQQGLLWRVGSSTGFSQKRLANAKISFGLKSNCLWGKSLKWTIENCLANLAPLLPVRRNIPWNPDKLLWPILCVWLCSWQECTEIFEVTKAQANGHTKEQRIKLSVRSFKEPLAVQRVSPSPWLSPSFSSQSPILSLRYLSCHRGELSTSGIITVAQNSTFEASKKSERAGAAGLERETRYFCDYEDPESTCKRVSIFTYRKGQNNQSCCPDNAVGEETQVQSQRFEFLQIPFAGFEKRKFLCDLVVIK